MKIRLLIILGIIASVGLFTPNVLASESFHGISSFERLPESIVPNNSQVIEIKFQYQDGPYSLIDLKPIIDVSPKEAEPYVHVEFEPIEGVYRNSIARIYGTITVDPNITSEKIFLNFSYVGTDIDDVLFKSGWNDSAIMNIRQNLSGATLDRTVYPVSLIESPLKQFKSGVHFSEIKCNGVLQLTQKYDGSPACVRSETVFELIKRGWVSDIIVAVQSRDVFLEHDATSSYIEKVIPTLEDFKHTLSEPYDINTIFSKFGSPHDDIGSGIHIYVYELNDSTEVWIGYTDHIWYVKHVNSDGNLLEELLVENEN